MHYYIYPKSGNAKYVAWAIDYLNNATTSSGGGGITYSFVDDSDKQISLEVLSGEIKSKIESKSAKLLLASKVYMDVLLDNVCKQGIQECVDGIKFIAKQLNIYLKEKYKNEKRLIAIILNGYEVAQKHLGTIPQILESNGFKIVYIVNFGSRWEKELEGKLQIENKDYIYAEFEFLENLDFFPFLINQANFVKLNGCVSGMIIVPSMENICNQVFAKQELIVAQKYSFVQIPYVNVHSNSVYEAVLNGQKYGDIYPNPSPRLIKGGYPSIDKQSEDIINLNVNRDTIILVSSGQLYREVDRFKKIVENIIDSGFRLVFKSHPVHIEYKDIEDNFASIFLNYENFIYYKQPRLEIKEIERSITLIAQVSSTAYSFPTLYKRPAILLYPKKTSLNENEILQDTFYNEKLHIRIFEEEDEMFVQIIKDLSQDMNLQKQWEQRIEDFRKHDLYNFGCASEYLANWIIEWYNKRDILVKE